MGTTGEGSPGLGGISGGFLCSFNLLSRITPFREAGQKKHKINWPKKHKSYFDED